MRAIDEKGRVPRPVLSLPTYHGYLTLIILNERWDGLLHVKVRPPRYATNLVRPCFLFVWICDIA